MYQYATVHKYVCQQNCSNQWVGMTFRDSLKETKEFAAKHERRTGHAVRIETKRIVIDAATTNVLTNMIKGDN